MRLLAFIALGGVALAIPVVPNDPAPAPIAAGCRAYVNQTACSDDKCCNWCGPNAPAPTTVGWCMPVLPVATGLVCTKEPPSCADLKSNETCAQEHECKWIPTSSLDPESLGLCVYDWNVCKSPPV